MAATASQIHAFLCRDADIVKSYLLLCHICRIVDCS